MSDEAWDRWQETLCKECSAMGSIPSLMRKDQKSNMCEECQGTGIAVCPITELLK